MKDAADTDSFSDTRNDQPILVAIDFSEDSKAALVWACKLAECMASPLILLHVVHDSASNPGFYHSDKTGHLQPMDEVAAAMMDEFLAQARNENPDLQSLTPGVAELRFVPGLPPTRIVEVAGWLDCCMIVMGNCGIVGVPNRRLGSVTERVAELSPIPVVIVKSENHDTLGKNPSKAGPSSENMSGSN